MAQLHASPSDSYQDSPAEQLVQLLESTQDAIMAISLPDRRTCMTWTTTTRCTEGRPVTVLGMLTDITARKQAEDALQEANCLLEVRIAERTAELQKERSLLQTVIDAMSEGLVVQGRDGAIQYCNRAALEILGVTMEELIGHTGGLSLLHAVREDGSALAADMHPANRRPTSSSASTSPTARTHGSSSIRSRSWTRRIRSITQL